MITAHLPKQTKNPSSLYSKCYTKVSKRCSSSKSSFPCCWDATRDSWHAIIYLETISMGLSIPAARCLSCSSKTADRAEKIRDCFLSMIPRCVYSLVSLVHFPARNFALVQWISSLIRRMSEMESHADAFSCGVNSLRWMWSWTLVGWMLNRTVLFEEDAEDEEEEEKERVEVGWM